MTTNPRKTGRRRVALSSVLAATTALGAATTAHAATPPYIFQPGLGSNNVSVINQDTGLQVRTVAVPEHPFIANSLADGSKVYFDTLGLWASHVSVVNTKTWATKTIALGGLPFATMLSPDDKTLYVLEANGTIAYVDTATDKVTRTIKLGNIGEGLEISPDGKTLYVSFATSKVVRIDIAKGVQVGAAINSGGLMPAWLGISKDGSRLYSLNFSSGTTAVIDTASWKQIALLDEGINSNPAIVDETPDASKVYISNTGGKRIDIYSTSTWKKVATIPTQGLAMDVEQGPDGYMYANDWGASTAPYGGNIQATAYFLLTSSTGGAFNQNKPGNLLQIDPLTDKVVRTTPTPPDPVMMDFTPAQP